MELPAYHLPTVGNVLRSMWERGWSFIKKAGTIILLSTILIWFVTYFGFIDGTFTMLSEDQIDNSILAIIGNGISWLFAPLGWGNWRQRLLPLPVWLQKKILLVHWVFCMVVQALSMQISQLPLLLSADLALWYSTFMCPLFCSNGCNQKRNA